MLIVIFLLTIGIKEIDKFLVSWDMEEKKLYLLEWCDILMDGLWNISFFHTLPFAAKWMEITA